MPSDEWLDYEGKYTLPKWEQDLIANTPPTIQMKDPVSDEEKQKLLDLVKKYTYAPDPPSWNYPKPHNIKKYACEGTDCPVCNSLAEATTEALDSQIAKVAAKNIPDTKGYVEAKIDQYTTIKKKLDSLDELVEAKKAEIEANSAKGHLTNPAAEIGLTGKLEALNFASGGVIQSSQPITITMGKSGYALASDHATTWATPPLTNLISSDKPIEVNNASVVQLPDGTEVYLPPGSAIRAAVEGDDPDVDD